MKQIKRCKYLEVLNNNQEVIYALEEISGAKAHLKQLRAEINHLSLLCADKKEKAVYENAVKQLTALYMHLLMTDEEIIENIESVEVEE